MTKKIPLQLKINISGVHRVSSILPFLAVLAHLLATQPAIGDEYLTASLVNENNKFHEVHEPEVNVSGNVIVGVMWASAHGALTEDSLGILPSETGDEKVCLKVTSRNGAYVSRNEYSYNVAAQRPIYLPYKSRMPEIIKGYEEHKGAIAVSATSGDCDNSANADYYLPANLDKKKAKLETGKLSIYINGFDATDIFYHISGTDDDQFVDCNYIEEGRHTAYNFSCEITSDHLSEPDALEIKIFREVYGRELTPNLVVRLLPTN